MTVPVVLVVTLQAWDATPVAEPPRPKPAPVEPVVPTPRAQTATPAAPTSTVVRAGDHGDRELTIRPNGTVQLRKIRFQISSRRAGQTIHAVWDPLGVVFADRHGEVLAEHPWPPKGTNYVSNGIPRGRPRKDPSVTEVLTHEQSPIS